MKRAVLICSLAALMLAGGLVTADARPPGPMGGRPGGPDGAGGPGGPFGRMMMGELGRAMMLRAELNVTDEQREQMHEIGRAHKDEFVAVMKPLMDAKRRLGEAVRANEVNENAVRTASAQVGVALADVALLRARVGREMRAVLTPEQLQKIDEFINTHDAAMDGWLQDIE